MNYLTTRTYRRPMEDMGRVFNQFFDNIKAPAASCFAVDIAEDSDSYRIEADLPGCSADDVDVRVEDNLLVIEARREEPNEKEVSWYIQERKSGNLQRSFILPKDVDKSKVDAEMKNGCLVVDLKKKSKSKPLSIKVQSKQD